MTNDNKSDRQILIDFWKAEEIQPFSGWDFSYIKDRKTEDPLPWDYAERAAALLDRASSVLDIGTGGGERFLQLKEYWPNDVVVSEGYHPNYILAKQRLEPLGVDVIELESSENVIMPFADNRFDLVLNRHSGFNPSEIGRILKRNCVFFTQQVHGRTTEDLLAAFDEKPPYPDANPGTYIPQLEKTSMQIVGVEDFTGEMQFSDVGAIVYFLKAIPWLVQGFSVDSHMDYLLELQRKFEAGQPLVFTTRYYLIEAIKK